MTFDVRRDPATGLRLVAKAAGDKSHPTNSGRLCTKGATTADMLAAGGRMDTAQVRPSRGEPPQPRDVDAAISEAAARLRSIVDEHGPDAVSLYVSGQMSLEAQYLANKLTKGFIGTNQIESNSRLCMASAGSGYKLSLGADGPPGSYEDFDHADVFFVIGANMADCHPILFLRLMDRVKAGAKLIVVDPRRTTTAEKSDLFMQIKPGTDLALLNGLLHLLVANGHTDQEFIDEFTEGWDVMPSFLDDYSPQRVSEITGIPEDRIRQAADWIGSARNWMSCWTMGLNQSTHGTWNTNALCNLHLATGAICELGSGPFSLTGQPNAMGGREMGYMGPGLPGQRSVISEADREFVEDRWRIPRGSLRTEVGGGTIEMFGRMAAGEIKACWIICTNPVATVANRKTVIEGLETAELVIAQDAFLETETNDYADIMLPAALWAESDGVMVGPGTGIAPFRGFLHERRALGHSGPNWLFFGEQHAATDFYYRDEIEAMHRDGFLTELELAFSRNQEQKVYVQDRMRERGAQLWVWLQNGAHFYMGASTRTRRRHTCGPWRPTRGTCAMSTDPTAILHQIETAVAENHVSNQRKPCSRVHRMTRTRNRIFLCPSLGGRRAGLTELRVVDLGVS
ncbi:molybdopterin-dependent oxidoreductase [Rhodococcus daqingensis]|uniref:Molybdopterin-dependent oxidoreductase n=1 Tax=Rhodococcus daqingensis TaxID=2479363 RepID=A0ABW2RX73_9NOCA